MSIIPRAVARSTNAALMNTAAAMAGTIARGAVNQLSANAVKYVGDAIRGGRTANLPQPTFSGGALRVMPTRSTRARNPSKRRMRVQRPLANTSSDRVCVQLRDAYELTNTGTGVYQNYLQIACLYTTGKDMRSWLPRAGTTVAGAFRYFRVTKLAITFQPTRAYSSVGVLCLGIDPAPEVTNPTTVSDVIRHDPSVLGDIKDAHTLYWTPDDNTEQLDHLTNALNTTTSPEHISQGTIQIYSSNGEAVSVSIGFLFIQAEVEYWGLF